MIPGSGVKIVLDRERTLRFDMNARVEFEEATGENSLEPAFWTKKMTAKNQRALIWACLVHEDPALTLKDVGAMLTPKMHLMAVEKLQQTLNESSAEADPEGEEGDGGKK